MPTELCCAEGCGHPSYKTFNICQFHHLELVNYMDIWTVQFINFINSKHKEWLPKLLQLKAEKLNNSISKTYYLTSNDEDDPAFQVNATSDYDAILQMHQAGYDILIKSYQDLADDETGYFADFWLFTGIEVDSNDNEIMHPENLKTFPSLDFITQQVVEHAKHKYLVC